MAPSRAARSAVSASVLVLGVVAGAAGVLGAGPAIRIESPAPDAVLTDGQVVVRGRVDGAPAEVGVTVNGFPAFVDGHAFVGVLPLPYAEPAPTELAVVAVDAEGRTLVRASVPVRVRPAGAASAVELHPPFFSLGTAPLKVDFSGWSAAPVETATFDARGNGSVDYRGADLTSLPAVTYDRAGVYVPTLTVNGTRRAAVVVRVYAKGELDGLLRAKWTGFRAALRRGDLDGAVAYFAIEKRPTYRASLNALTIPVARFGRLLGDISLPRSRGSTVEYDMIATNGERSSVVQFTLDHDGIWRLRFI
jgi:hypothetical protein